MSLKPLDQAKAIIKFSLKQRKRRVDEMSTETKLSEKQKVFIGEELSLIENVNTLLKFVELDIAAKLGNVPANDLQLEQTVLGSIIYETPAQEVIPILRPEAFFETKHRVLFETLMKMQADEIGIDMRSVIAKLRDTDQIKAACGDTGPTYIVELTNKVSQTHNIQTHARILTEFAIKRELIKASSQLIQDLYSGGDCFDALEFAEKRIAEIKTWIK